MSSLSSTTWQVVGDSGVDKWTMTFNNDGTVALTAAGVAQPTGYYAELTDGSFIIQEPGTTGNPKIGTVWAGRHTQGVGVGYIQTYPGTAQNFTALTNFSMTKSPV